MTAMGVRTEYEMNSSRKRDYLTVWSGSFCSVYEAIGVSLPKMNGYMLTTYNDDRVKVTCPAPRSESNCLEVDAAITKALSEHYARIGASSVNETGLDAAVRAVVEPPRITAIDRVISCGSCALTGLFNDGSTKKLFSYYIDELTICDAHLIGLTEDEAHQLRQSRDVAYLRS